MADIPPSPPLVPPPRYMTDAFSAFYKLHKDSHVPLRTAAYMKALQRVAVAQVNRGFD